MKFPESSASQSCFPALPPISHDHERSASGWCSPQLPRILEASDATAFAGRATFFSFFFSANFFIITGLPTNGAPRRSTGSTVL